MNDESHSRRKVPPLSKEHLDRIDRAWDALEDGDPESAGLEAEELMGPTEGHPEVRFLLGAALLESGVPHDALEHLQASSGLVEDDLIHRFYLASALYENQYVEQAVELFRKVIEQEPEAAPPRYGLAQGLEFLGQQGEAEQLYESAYKIDPDGFPPPIRMKKAAFERVVAEAAQLLPEDLRAHLTDLPIVVKDLPAMELLRSETEEDPISPSVLGLFVGTSLKERSVFAPVMLPPTVFIFQKNLERFCQTREELIHEIHITLYHEIGHYLGLSEEELEERGLE